MADYPDYEQQTNYDQDPQPHSDDSISFLRIVCILLSFVGAVSIFLPVIEASGYNSSSLTYYTIPYNGFNMLLDPDFLAGGIYDTFPLFARLCPILISILYLCVTFRFYLCSKTRPGFEVPTCLILILIFSYLVSICALSTPYYEDSYLKESLYNGIGNMVFFWDSVALLILGFILKEKMKDAGIPE